MAKRVRTLKIGEKIKREYHREVKRLKSSLSAKGIELKTYDKAENYDMCILSSSEYEIGCEKEKCSSENENYFVTDEQYFQITSE